MEPTEPTQSTTTEELNRRSLEQSAELEECRAQVNVLLAQRDVMTSELQQAQSDRDALQRRLNEIIALVNKRN